MVKQLEWERLDRGFPYWVDQWDVEPDGNTHYHVAKSTAENDQYPIGSVFTWYNNDPIPFNTVEDAKQWCEMHWMTRAGE